MLQSIPLEILVEISKYLDYDSFQELRKSSSFILSMLPSRPKLYLAAFKSSYKQLKSRFTHNCKCQGFEGRRETNSNSTNANHIWNHGRTMNPTNTNGSESGNSTSTRSDSREEYPRDWSYLIGLDSSEACNLNAFQFLVRFGFKDEFEKLLNINAKQKNHLSLQELEILMGIATDGVYDHTVTYINLTEDFGYNKDIAWLLINYRPYDFIKKSDSTNSLVEHDISDETSIVLSAQPPQQTNRPATAPAANIENATSPLSPSTFDSSSLDTLVSKRNKTYANHWRIMQIITIASFQNDIRIFSHYAPKLFNHPKNHYLPLLHCSLAKGCESVAMYILNNWPNIDPSLDDNSALILACKVGIVPAVLRLLEFPAVIPDISCALAAVTFNHTSILDILLRDNRLDPSIHSNVLLGCAIHCNRPEIFQKLLNDRRIDPSANNNDLLQVAVTHGIPTFVEMLLAHERVKPTGALQLAAIRILIKAQ